MSKAARQVGIVKWFNDAKGYGFIQVAGEDEIFVHYSAIAMPGRKTLNEGDHVELTLVAGAKGNSAENVVVISG